MGDYDDAASDSASQINESQMIEVTGRILLVAVISLCFVVVCIFLINLFIHWFWHSRRNPSSAATRRQEDPQEVALRLALRRGLDPSVLKTIPEVEFSSKDYKDGGFECVVCLCEFCEGEKARFLPKCNHGFHVECIDTWFQSHSTCPLCRNPILNPNPAPESSAPLPGSATASAVAAPNFPTNVLFWGDDTHVSTLGQLEQPSPEPEVPCSSSAAAKVSSSNRAEGVLVIDVPGQSVECDRESPMMSRLRSLKRLLSMEMRLGRRVNVDLEQGGRS